MTDTIETIGRSLVQHGPCSDRVYIMKLHPRDLPGIVDTVSGICRDRGYSKVFAKIPASCRVPFDGAGYIQEARIPRLYDGCEDAVFMSLYLSFARAREKHSEQIVEILRLTGEKAASKEAHQYGVEELGPDEIERMCELYREVFPTYPFPIHDPAYILETMMQHVRYFGIRLDGRIVALSSAEMDRDARCVEMTDFATLPRARGRSMAIQLLGHMHRAMESEGMVTAYTICRALSAGMNITFARHGYRHAGTLTNNTNISGSIESMNVWYRSISARGKPGI